MSDITLCDNRDCPARKRCARAMRAPSQVQSWCKFPFWDDGQDHGVVCDYRIPWPRVNHDKVETMLADLLAKLEAKEDSDDACADLGVECDRKCDECCLGSDENFEDLLDELRIAVKEQG